MPSTRPCAAFEPISPDFNLKALVETTPNFEWVVRIHCDMIDHQGVENFEKLVLIHVILGGKPLVIEGYEGRLDRWTYALQWLRDNCGSKVENARDLTKKTNVPLSIGHYLNNMAILTNQWNAQNYKDPQRQRMYLKDIDCPSLWQDKLSEILPAGLFYLNESTGEVGGFGAVDEVDPLRPGMRKGKGIAKAGDLMSSLPKEMRAENLMCYIGHEGTYTPAHREMCASLGQNIMVEASTGLVEDGKLTKPGSSIWFMTESKEREVVSEYWLSRLGHDIEIENHFAQINAWKNAPFKTYVVEQKPGDFILIPPLAPHQVWNRGTRTMKIAWNRTTVETLEMALHEALPRARMVCRDEQYKNKAIVYYTMQKYSKLLRSTEKLRQRSTGPKQKGHHDSKVRQLEKDFRRLQHLFTEIMVSESFLPDKAEKKVEMVPYDSNITCSYCRCNIFNRFLTCPNCVETLANGDEDTYDVCMECYAMGRSCACISKLRWVEQWSWAELTQKHEQWRHQILQCETQVTDRSPVSLKTELERMGNKRTLAQICQLELAKRPFRDIRKPAPRVAGDDRVLEDEVDADGNVKKKKKVKRSEKFVREHARCHLDSYWEPKWKQALCTVCAKSYCYGKLFRAYDMMPQDVLADPDWKCPSCRNICACRVCRKRPGYRPYNPSGTILGHNTKEVADPRSVESLVDFSYSNIAWIQKAGDDNGDDTRRLKKRRKEADAAKASEPQLGDDYVDAHENEQENDGIEDGILKLAEQEGIPLDPALGTTAGFFNGSGDDEDEFDENPEGPSPGPSTPVAGTVSQYAVPEGGVIRDAEHAYSPTEAITYDYPDPEMGRHLVVPTEEEESALTSGYEPAVPPGYGPAGSEDPGVIEMEPRKRKRTKLDDGDRSYASKRPNPHKKTKQQRKSLVVKLPISQEKLAETEKVAAMARRALTGVEVPAPVISSDLQALNAAEGNPQTASKRVRRSDHIVFERDDDFTPHRTRDRRKTDDGESRPRPDAEITRRQTRLQAIHYEEPSEEEFNEELVPETSERPKNRIVRLDEADFSSGSHSSTTSESTDEDDDSASSLPPKIATGPVVAPRVAQKTAKLTVMHSAPVAQDSPAEQSETPTSFASFEPSPIPITVTNSSAASGREPPLSLAEAQANRRAKMAAIEWMENDNNSLGDAWSDQDSFLGESAASEAAPEPATAPIQSEQPSPSTAPVQSEQPSPSTAPVQSEQPSPSTAPVQSEQPSPSPPPPPPPPPPLPPQRTSRPPVMLKASAADWVDSDDSDDGMPVRKPGQGWTAVNGGRAPVKRVPLSKPAAPPAAGVGKKRGRPWKHYRPSK